MRTICFLTFLACFIAVDVVQGAPSLGTKTTRDEKRTPRNLQHFACPSSNSRLCIAETEDCDESNGGCQCKIGYERDPSCVGVDHSSFYCTCIDQNECTQDNPPCPEVGSFCVDYDPPERYKCGCLPEFIPVLPSSTVDPVPREWRPLSCVLSAVENVTFADVANGTTIDTSSEGMATGSFLLQGSAPPGTTNVLLQVLSDDTVVLEEAQAEIVSEDSYETKWEIEVNALQSGGVTFVVIASGAFGSQNASLTVNLVAPGPDESLLQPTFAFTPQFYDRLLSYNSVTGTLVFSSNIATALRLGNGLASGPIDFAPDGYLRIITGAEYESSSGTTVVSTRQAGLAEFIRRLSLSYRSSESPQVANDTSFELGGVRERRSLLQIGPNTNLKVNLNFDPSASIDIDIRWDKGDSWISIPFPVLERFFFEIGFEFKGVVSLEHTVEQLINKPPTKFGPDIEGTFARILIPTPFFVPIPVTFEFESGLKYSVQLETQCVIEYSPKLGFKAGYEYLANGAGRGAYTIDTSSASETDVDLGGKASLTVQSEVEVQALLFGAVGVEVECSPGLVFEAAVDLFDGQCKWKVDLAVPFEAGVELELEFGPFEKEFETAVRFLTISLTLLSGTVEKLPSAAPSVIPSMFLPSDAPTNTPAPSMQMPSSEPTPRPTTPRPTTPPPTRPPSPTRPPPPTPDNNNCGATSDPHFTSWTTRYSYQGACDLVFVRNSMVEVQIRTKFGSNSRFSFVSNAAISIGGEVLEVLSNGTYFVNGVEPLSSDTPATIGGSYPFTVGSGRSFFRISLSGGQRIQVRFYRDTITIEIAGHLSDFGDSVGFMGSYGEQEFPYRDGSLRFLGSQISVNTSDYANEWAVSASKGDTSLFMTPAETGGCVEASSFATDASLLQMAEAACASLPDDGTRQNCIFDILASGDMEWAENPGFTDPLQPAESQCVEGGMGECENLGGECRWRCNDSDFACLPNICTLADELPLFDNTPQRQRHLAVVEGCSCALPLPNPTSSPTTFPTVSQSRLNEVITCIAVIDESRGSQSLSGFQSLWTEFRTRYPERPFCLLQPEPNSISELFVPEAFLNDTNTIYSPVSRDNGVEVEASDWFDVCGLAALRAKGILDVAIFIDNSGSLTTSQVRASNDMLLSRMEAEGLNLVAGISNSREDWISPFLTDFN